MSRAVVDRPPLVLVAGTGTDVGKTWVGSQVLTGLRDAGVPVAARKPVQSFDLADPPSGRDAAVLAAASGEEPTTVCPPHRSYPVPMAPPIAAEVLGAMPFTIADLVSELVWPPVGVGLVETAGGVRSPQAADGDVVQLCRALGPAMVLLVADAGLGTIHAVRSSAAALTGGPDEGRLATVTSSEQMVVVLNRFDRRSELHQRNLEWLAGRDGFEVVCLPGQEQELVQRVHGACGLTVPDPSSVPEPERRGPGMSQPNPSE